MYPSVFFFVLIKSYTDIHSYTYALPECSGPCFIKMGSYYTYLSSNCFSHSTIPYRNPFKLTGGEFINFYRGPNIPRRGCSAAHLPCHPVSGPPPGFCLGASSSLSQEQDTLFHTCISVPPAAFSQPGSHGYSQPVLQGSRPAGWVGAKGSREVTGRLDTERGANRAGGVWSRSEWVGGWVPWKVRSGAMPGVKKPPCWPVRPRTPAPPSPAAPHSVSYLFLHGGSSCFSSTAIRPPCLPADP